MKKFSSIIWGVVLVAAGVIFGLNAFNVTDINVFFDGWWTLFIIIPCLVGVFSSNEKTGNLIGVGVGVFLLLCCQNILDFDVLWKLAAPAIIVIIGCKMIFGGFFTRKSEQIMKDVASNGGDIKRHSAVFSGNDLNYSGYEFNGAELEAIFGGIKCDLRGAIIDKDCVIKAHSVFGGIDIFVPDNVNVKVNSNSIFGGASNKKNNSNLNAVTVYVNCTCMFGGVDIK